MTELNLTQYLTDKKVDNLDLRVVGFPGYSFAGALKRDSTRRVQYKNLPVILKSQETLASMSDVPSDFTISDEQALKAFSDYESRAKRAGSSGQQPVIGERHVVDVAYLNEAVVQLSIVFTPPLVVAQKRGYRFGSVRGRTAADRQTMINQMNARVERGRREVAFETVLIVPAAVEDDENASLPSISFALLDKDGKRLRPRRTPDLRLRAMPTGSADPPSVAFPLYTGETPNLTNEMDKVTLVVVFDGDEESEETLEFRLSK